MSPFAEAKFYVWEVLVQQLYTYNSPFNLVKQGNDTRVGLIADDMNTYKALLAISAVPSEVYVPPAVQLKLGLFAYDSVNSESTNNSILRALLKIREQNIYVIAQVNYSTNTIFPAIRDELFELGKCSTPLVLYVCTLSVVIINNEYNKPYYI